MDVIPHTPRRSAADPSGYPEEPTRQTTSTRRRFAVRSDPGHYSSLPLDMLRYDACWPQSQADVRSAEDPGGHRDDDGVTRVVLLTDSASAPSRARWASFGWHVIDVETLPAP